MAKIRCGAATCSHNRSGVCYANCIDIVGGAANRGLDTACGSFLNKLHYSELTNNILGSGSCDCLKCMVATCRFHSNQLCTLDDIEVSGENAEYYTQTACHSFRPAK